MTADEAEGLLQRAVHQPARDVPPVTERGECLAALLARLEVEAPIVRHQVIAAARARLAEGDHPTAEVLAGTLVDLLVDQRRR